MVVRALLLCVSVLGLAACSGKPSERRVHENQPGSFAEAPMSKTEAKGQIGALYAKRAETAKRLKEAKNGADALAIAKELGAVVLNTTVLATPEFSGTPEFDVVLGQFHAALDKAFKLDRKAVEESGILARYEDVVLAFCNENNEGCVRLKIFKGDQLAGRILMHVAETLETGMVAARDQRDALIMRKEPNSRIGEATRALQTIVIRFYRLLQLAYEMGNGTANPDLDRKYVTYASAYFEYFRALPEDQKQNEFHRRHRDVMTLALGHMRNQSNTTGLSKVYCDFLIKLNPLDPNAFAALDLDRRAQLSMTNEFITCTGTGKAKTLKKMIEVVLQKQNAAAKVKFEEDAKNPKSVLTVQSEGYGYAMAALADTPYLYNGLNAKLTPRADLPFFIVDRVYYQQLDLNSALAYWQRAENVDEIEFLEFVRNYARVQIAYVIKVTQKNYARVFEERFAQRNSIGADFFQDVIKEVNGTMQSDWTDVRERQYMIRELLIRLFDAKYGRTVDQSRQKVQREYLNLKAELNNLPHLISMSTTVPMAIPLHYYMSKVQGAIKILVNWWNSTSKYFDIVAVNAVDRLLTGDSTTQAAFFEFGRVYYRFDHLEKLHVFDFALRTGLFDAINFALLEEDKALNMDPEALFFKEATKSALGSFEGSFRIAIDELEKVATSADFKQVLIGACNDPLAADVALDLSQFRMNTLSDTPGISGPSIKIYDRAALATNWRNARLQMDRYVEVLRHHLYADNAESRLSPRAFKNRDKIMNDVRGEIENIQRLERKMFELSFRLDRQLVRKQADCLERFTRADFYRRAAVLQMNADFYRDVHAAMTVLRLVAQDLPTVQSAIQAVQAGNMEADVKARALKLLQNVQASGIMGLPEMSLQTALNEALNIHNVSDPIFANLGFLVDGYARTADTARLSPERIKSKNDISADFFVQIKWDQVIRSRHMINKGVTDGADAGRYIGVPYSGRVALGPNTQITLGTRDELLENGEYKDNTPKKVPFTANQRDFVRQAMFILAGPASDGNQYISWYSTGGLGVRLLERRLNWMRDLQKLGTIETSDGDARNCAKDMWGRARAERDMGGRVFPLAPSAPNCQAVRVSAKDMAEYYLKVLNAIRITPSEMDLLELMDRPGKMEDRLRNYLEFKGEANDLRKWGYFDHFYRMYYSSSKVTVKTEAGAEEEWVQRLVGADDFVSYRDSFVKNVERAAMLFPYGKFPSQLMRSAAREKLFGRLDDVTMFEEQVAKIEDSGRDLGDIYYMAESKRRDNGEMSVPDRYRPNERFWRVMHVEARPAGSPRAGTPQYLRDDQGAKTDYRDYIQAYITKDTNCDVLPNPLDPDFQGNALGLLAANPQKSCLERYGAWKKLQDAKRSTIRNAVYKVEE